MKIKQIVESSVGATASGSVASVVSPLGKTQTRNQKPPKSPKVTPMRKGKKGQYGNSFESDTSVGDKGGQVTSYMVRNKETVLEGSIKSIATDIDELSEIAFKKKYGKSKEEMRKSLKEEKIDEADLIVMPGMRRMKDTSFIPHEKDRRDHEVEMARSELYAAAKDAMRIFKLLKDRSEEDGLMGWQQSYITLASDYLNSVADSIEYNNKVKGSLDEMTGGVLAGGMSNFEEDAVTELSPKTKKSYSAAAKDDKKFNDNSIEKAKRMSQEQPHKKAEWEDEIEFLKSVNAKRDRGLARAGVAEGSEKNVVKSVKVGNFRHDLVDTGFGWQVRIYNGDELYDSGLSKNSEQKGLAALDDAVSYTKKQLNIKEQGVAEGAPELLKKEMPLVRHAEKLLAQNGVSKDDPDYQKHLAGTIKHLRKFGNIDLINKQGVAEGKCPKCGGVAYSEEKIAEAKDACYHKVKSRYKVWPSAYASGALVKCRKVGASNWGNKSKK